MGRGAQAIPRERLGVMNSALYVGEVMHRRHIPVGHRFTYGVYYLLIDIDELPTLDRQLVGFGFGRAAPFSFHARDHGPRDGSPLRPWFERQLAEAGIDLEGGAVRILTMPRVFGYVFNPISVWFGYGPAGDLRGVLYEVSNTFGQWHHHLFAAGAAGDELRHVFDKELAVSPFIGMEATYEFRVHSPDERASIVVREFEPAGQVLTATFVARRRELTTASLWGAFVSHPLITLKVMGGIQWQALQLVRKRVRWFHHGEAPTHQVTIGRKAGTYGAAPRSSSSASR